jgi:hypothetical protein
VNSGAAKVDGAAPLDTGERERTPAIQARAERKTRRQTEGAVSPSEFVRFATFATTAVARFPTDGAIRATRLGRISVTERGDRGTPADSRRYEPFEDASAAGFAGQRSGKPVERPAMHAHPSHLLPCQDRIGAGIVEVQPLVVIAPLVGIIHERDMPPAWIRIAE